MVSPESETSTSQLVEQISCPNCWHDFPPHELHFISTSPQLTFDHIVQNGSGRRFLPTNFSFNGDAIDPGGGLCTETACPECHLKIPRLLAQKNKISISIFGAPGSGKSYLLASMTHKLAEVFPELGVIVDDVDAEANTILHEYEKELFYQPTPTTKVTLKKTDTFGDWYNTIKWQGMERILPKPFLFSIENPGKKDKSGLSSSKVLCLYDNAGESFEPGAETEDAPVTRHMSKADGLIFVLDLTQEAAFRKACQSKSNDPQWRGDVMHRQTALFSEAMSRILRFRGELPTARVDTPIVISLPKFDAWSFLLAEKELPSPWKPDSKTSAKCFDPKAVYKVSNELREILRRYTPAMLSRIESTFDPEKTIYVPTSATGCAPRKNSVSQEDDGAELNDIMQVDLSNVKLTEENQRDNYFLAGDINPIWAEIPALALLQLVAPDLIPSS